MLIIKIVHINIWMLHILRFTESTDKCKWKHIIWRVIIQKTTDLLDDRFWFNERKQTSINREKAAHRSSRRVHNSIELGTGKPVTI